MSLGDKFGENFNQRNLLFALRLAALNELILFLEVVYFNSSSFRKTLAQG